MKNVMTHNGYQARIEFDPDDNVFVGHIAGIRDIVGFHADSVGDLRAAFEDAVEDYIETCEKVGKTPERAASGRMMLRVDPQIHSAALKAAQLAGESLNQWSEKVIGKAAHDRLSTKGVHRTAS